MQIENDMSEMNVCCTCSSQITDELVASLDNGRRPICWDCWNFSLQIGKLGDSIRRFVRNSEIDMLVEKVLSSMQKYVQAEKKHDVNSATLATAVHVAVDALASAARPAKGSNT